MSDGKHYVGGELFLSLEIVAEIYKVKALWLQEVHDCGLLRGRADAQLPVCIAAAEMDRVATIVRLHVVLGLDLDTIVLTLEDE